MKKKKRFGNIILHCIFILLGFLCGYMASRSYNAMFVGGQMGFGMFLFTLVVLVVACQLHIIIHESGHLVFGLLTGYRFSSFRIGSHMFCLRDGKLLHKRYVVSGTGGQCLMVPPEYNDGNFPYLLYNFGGSLMNLIFAGLFYLVSRNVYGYASLCFGILALVGLVYALVNGIPMRLAMVDNDGSNALEMKRSKQARHAFWVQLMINDHLSHTRLKDMPEEWFQLPDAPDYDSALVGSVAVFAENRALDEMNFAHALDLIQKTEAFRNLPGLYRIMLALDKHSICLLQGQPAEEFTKQELQLMKQMKNLPSILRTKYIDTLLNKQDLQKANQIKAEFETAMQNYPYSAEAEGERALMAYAATQYEN